MIELSRLREYVRALIRGVIPMRHSDEEKLRILLDHITQAKRDIMAAIDDLNTAVQANTAATQAAVAAFGAAVNNDPAIETAATTIAANTAALVAATPVAPAPAA